MTSLEDLAKNAIPPKPEEVKHQNTPVEYRLSKDNIPEMSNENVSPSSPSKRSLSEVSLETFNSMDKEEHIPTYYEREMSKIDKAIERNKREMWDNLDLEEATKALEANMTFGEGGEDAYFNSEIDASAPIGKVDSTTVHESIEIPEEISQKINKVEETSISNDEDDFLSDDSIYNDNNTIIEERKEDKMAGKYLDGFDYDKPNVITPRYKEPVVNRPQATVEEAPKTEGPVLEEQNTPKESSDIPAYADSAPIEYLSKNEPTFTNVSTSYGDSIIDEAFRDSEVEEDDDSVYDLENYSEREDVQKIKELVRNEVKPVQNVVDLKRYKIATKPISASRVMGIINDSSDLPTGKWVLPASRTSIIMSSVRGTEIDLLANRRQGQTELMRNQEIVQILYNHVVSSKPETWEAWAKTILYDDFSHLYFCLNIACFANSCFIPHECDKDKYSFMEKASIMDMVKYKNDAAKEYCEKLLESDPQTDKVHTTLVQISDKVAISLRKPTVWNVLFEDLYLPDKIRKEMQDIMNIFRHTDNIYIIGGDGLLYPVDTKPVSGNMTKTLKNRFKIYYDILKSLTSDQLMAIYTYIAGELHKEADFITYQYPETTCPKCGNKIKAMDMAPIDILFTRHQLQIVLV